MRKYRKLFALVLGLAVETILPSAKSFALDKCHPNISDVDVCHAARAMQHDIEGKLPQSLSSLGDFTKVFADGTSLNVTMTLSSDKKNLKDASGHLVKPKLFAQRAAASLRSDICQDDVFASFVIAGGRYVFHYLFSDGNRLVDVIIDKCP